jgi:diacylglycerol kinase family enzyme
LLPALRFGTIDREERAETLLAKQVTVATRREKVINVDGELSETAPAKFRILPQSMTVFAPPSA